MDRSAALAKTMPIHILREIVQCYGTPTYAYDIGQIRKQIVRLKASLPQDIDLFYSLKANPSFGLCSLIATCTLGADVASAGELLTALRAGFPPERILISGPYKSPELLDLLHFTPQAIFSIDSVSELRTLAARNHPCRALLRLRPDFTSAAAVSTGVDSRFGIPFQELPHCREYLTGRNLTILGFHIFSGSQILDTDALLHHLQSSMTLSLRASDLLGLTPKILNLGGGFGIPYGPDDQELDLTSIGATLESLLECASPAQIILELGRYVVAQAGWYLTTVVAHQTYKGRPAVVVDGGVHQRTDLCELGLRTKAFPPLVLNGKQDVPHVATDVLGCLCLPDDVLAESILLPPLSLGNILAFPNTGAYGFSASPTAFLSHPAPAEVAFEGTTMELLRARQATQAFLEDQTCLVHLKLPRA